MYPKMKKLYIYTIVFLLLAGLTARAQEKSVVSQMDSIILGNSYGLMAGGNAVGGSDLFERSPEVDIAKALYGQFSGLLVKQGTGRSEENQSKLRLHGHSPLVLVDGFPRDLSDITGLEIESIEVLKDAAAAALYGVKGANGVVSIKTKRGKATPLKVTAKYQYGLATATRTPEFSNAYTYAYYMNQARELDGLPARFSNEDLNAFYAYAQGSQPADVYAYPNVDWWNEIYRSHGDNHRAQFTFTGGNLNFRYFAAVDYLKDDALYVRPDTDDRYNAHVYDNRLGIRANVDVNVTDYTAMRIGVMARLSEFNTPNWDTRLEKALYKLPASAFPIKHSDGTYGGNSIYGNVNPVAQLYDSGQHTYNQTKVLADMTLRQDLSPLLEGLSAEAAVAFDYIGKMTETATKEYQYAELVNGTLQRYGTNSKVVEFSHWFNSLSMKFELNAHLDYKRSFGDHNLAARLGYRQRSWVENERNASSKTQEILGTASYNWKERVFADLVVNYSGSAYLAPGKRFNWYPALSLAAILSTEPYIKVFASGGLSGSDGDLEHELWRQAYGSSNGHSYNFGTAVTSYSGRAEGTMAALTLAPERALTFNLGAEGKFLSNRLYARAEAFYEDRTNIRRSFQHLRCPWYRPQGAERR